MADIYRILDVIRTSVKRCILATIIHVEGSAYRKEGTSMLFLEDGTQMGVLSAGCLEVDLTIRARDLFDARKLFEKGITHNVVYDMRAEDDLSWGKGAGCGGVVHILLEPVYSELREHLGRVKSTLSKGISVRTAKKLSPDFTASDYIFVTDDQQTFGNWKGEIPAQLKARFNPTSGVSDIQSSSASMYFHCYHPKPRLIVFGAGPDVKPLCTVAAQTGFSVAIADCRPAWCNTTHFPDADILVVGSPRESINKLRLTSNDYVVIMTHDFQRDQEILELIIDQKLRYLGIMGAHERTRRLLNVSDIPDWIHSPVGLPISAESPEEIAISILAELIQTSRGTFYEEAHHRNLSCSR